VPADPKVRCRGHDRTLLPDHGSAGGGPAALTLTCPNATFPSPCLTRTACKRSESNVPEHTICVLCFTTVLHTGSIPADLQTFCTVQFRLGPTCDAQHCRMARNVNACCRWTNMTPPSLTPNQFYCKCNYYVTIPIKLLFACFNDAVTGHQEAN
jgi:hypothetical protein